MCLISDGDLRKFNPLKNIVFQFPTPIASRTDASEAWWEKMNHLCL